MPTTAGEIVIFDSTTWITLAVILVLLLLSAFFSGSETALTAASRGKLRAQADRKNRGAERALALTEDSERLIGAILLGNNLVNILATSLATSLFTSLFGDSGVVIATGIMTVLVLVFAEVMPKTYAITNAELAATRVAMPVSIVVRLLAPVVSTVRLVVRLMLRIFGVRTDPNAHVLAHEEIAGAIALHHSEGGVEKDDRDRLLGALDLKNRVVEEIMLHRSNIEMIDADAPPAEILSQCLSSSFTRIPVYRGEPENVVGVVHAKDLLRAVNSLVRDAEGGLQGIEKFNVMGVAMAPYFIPDTTTLDEQMREFLRRRTHFALVVDEYGSLRGLITLEDILEEIVGEIADEHDVEEAEVDRQTDGTVIVEGSMTIRDLNRACEWSLPDDEANTVAGLVIHEARMIPSKGQVFVFHGFRFEVLERERNRITKLRLRRLDG
ncbi:HlyC/CorC family transporter [Abyssibius alkaniclasticus]|uniref:HlyC/CorC family transporter n=1 Tax=Abyssibius alkaniclasticus TaxID=2881234 RepID=UPI004057E75E|tara:strand:- start:272 stop:1588 length:1317 start_codon:yes stop_codon:yes gene_type:complete